MCGNLNQTKVLKRLVGRPKQLEAKIRQYFYINETELKLVQEVASKKQLSVSAFVRTTLLDVIPKI